MSTATATKGKTSASNTESSRTSSTVEPATGILGEIKENREVLGFMTPPAMNDLLFISHFEAEDPDSPAENKHGYQRQPLMERIPNIAKFYLDENDPTSSIPTLILSVRLKDERAIKDFIELFKGGDLDKLRKRYGNKKISVVDGQHRYLGLVEANRIKPSFMPHVPVHLHFGLSFEDEARLFDVTNSTQRKLPRALIESTKVDVTEVGEPTHAQRIRLIAKAISESEKSPWNGLVNMTGAKSKQPVTFEGVRRSTGQMFPKELLERLATENKTPEDVAVKYWSLVADACSIAWKDTPRVVVNDDGEDVEEPVKYRIKELVGLAALSKLGQNIIVSSLEHNDFDKRMAQLVSKLEAVDWEKSKENPWMRNQQAGFAGQPELHAMLYRWVYSGIRPR